MGATMQILYLISLVIGLLVCSSHQFLFLNNIFKGGLKSGLKLGAVKSTKVSDSSPPPKENCRRVPHKKCQQILDTEVETQLTKSCEKKPVEQCRAASETVYEDVIKRQCQQVTEEKCDDVQERQC